MFASNLSSCNHITQSWLCYAVYIMHILYLYCISIGPERIWYFMCFCIIHKWSHMVCLPFCSWVLGYFSIQHFSDNSPMLTRAGVVHFMKALCNTPFCEQCISPFLCCWIPNSDRFNCLISWPSSSLSIIMYKFSCKHVQVVLSVVNLVSDMVDHRLCLFSILLYHNMVQDGWVTSKSVLSKA